MQTVHLLAGDFRSWVASELALTEVSGTEVLLLVPSVTAGAAGASDPARGGVPAGPFSILLGARPQCSGWGRWGGAVAAAARGAPCVF